MSITGKIVELYSAEQIRRRLDELAWHVDEDYKARPLLLLGILNGGRRVTEELAHRLRIRCAVEYVSASSYGDRFSPVGPVKVELRTCEPIVDRHILLVDDIVDTGHTLSAVIARLEAERFASLRTFLLTNKPLRRQVRVPLDYVGFTVPNKFIVGFGMGYGEQFRELPFLGYLATTK